MRVLGLCMKYINEKCKIQFIMHILQLQIKNMHEKKKYYSLFNAYNSLVYEIDV